MAIMKQRKTVSNPERAEQKRQLTQNKREHEIDDIPARNISQLFEQSKRDETKKHGHD